MRTVNFWNELSNMWVFNAEVRIIPITDLFTLKAISLGTVEYTDGSYLDIYRSIEGELVGVDWPGSLLDR